MAIMVARITAAITLATATIRRTIAPITALGQPRNLGPSPSTDLTTSWRPWGYWQSGDFEAVVAFGWIGATTAFASVVRKLDEVRAGGGFDFVPRSPLNSVQIPPKANNVRSSFEWRTRPRPSFSSQVLAPVFRECPLCAKTGPSSNVALVKSRCGAVALGRTYLLPPLSSGGALMVPPWLRFHIPLIELATLA